MGEHARVNIKSTMIYIHIEKALFHQGCSEEFHVKVAKTAEEACQLVEVGFEYVCHIGEYAMFRKRK